MNKNLFVFLTSLSTVLLSPVAPIFSEATAVEIEQKPINRLQIIYLAQSKSYKRAIDLYEKYHTVQGKHDFEILELMAKAILEQGAKSQDPQNQLLSIYAAGIAGLASSYEIIDAGINSNNPQTQLATIHLLAQIQDDYIDHLLNKAMASDFLYTRLEAAYMLSARKTKNATGQVEALMHKLPPQMSYFFPELFALIGTTESISMLRHMIGDRFQPTRIEAILSAARHGRDDLLPMIRSCATHINIGEQEASAAALGFFKDSLSIPRLKKLSVSNTENVQLSALRALYMLGDDQAKQGIIEKAKLGNLFAITMLGDIPGTDRDLIQLLTEEDLSIRFNAATSLLKRKNALAVPYLKEFLIRDTRDLGFSPVFSPGNSMRALKVISSVQQQSKQNHYDFAALSLSVREGILKDCLELHEEAFLKIAQLIIETRQNDLIPLTVSLLENLKTEKAVELLKIKSQTAGAPLIRAYCNLALVRMKEPGPYQELLKQWIASNKSRELIEFRPSLAWGSRLTDTPFELTPQESSSLLIQAYQVLAEKHEEQSIETILDAMRDGEPKNLPIMAGILLRAMQ
ncbi:MAG: HEAT repeat domain-containing protein [Chlamydiae bacterium]|nr:HEAT repeat domain-containing protein [Chlamydiota bacterium]